MEKHLPIIFQALDEYRMRTQFRLKDCLEAVHPEMRNAVPHYEEKLKIIDDAIRYLKTNS